MTLWTVTVTSLRELLRRRTALAFVFLLPVVFYIVRLDVPWQALRFVALGIGWAVATLALFSHVGARQLDRRLSVVGASPTALFLGRQLALLGVGVLVAAVYFVVVALTQDIPRLGALALLLATTVLIAAPLGAIVGMALPRELEGALALLSLMALQLLVDPVDASAKLLPFWSTRELSAYAIEPVGEDSLGSGLVHFAITLVVCVGAGWLVSVLRLRPKRWPEPEQEPEPRVSAGGVSAGS